MNSKPKQLPPRWLNCPRKGELIAGKFLPFKTPLSSDYDDQVPDENRFSPSMLISNLKSRKIKIGLWIDLTNTSRFYDYKEIEKNSITYMKLACKGRDECPTEAQTEIFLQKCQKFILDRPTDIIAIHCTHGFNRTGFLIVAFLVQILDYSVDAAIQLFKKMRDPGIYKHDYMRELARRYGDPSDIPSVPSRPAWCNEFDDGVDDDGLSLNDLDTNNDDHSNHKGGSPRKRRKEFNKKNPTFMDGINGVTAVTEPNHLSKIQRICQEMCCWNSSGFPGSQPVSMDVKNVNFLTEKPYKVSWKADGTRYMMLINGENEVYFIDRDNAVYQVSGLRFLRRKNMDEHLSQTLVDGEMIIDKVDGQDYPRYLIYDIIKFENQDVGKTDFERRLYCIGREIVGVRKQAIMEGRIDRNQEPFSVRNKEFWDISMAHSLLSPKFTMKVGHEIDGLIFQPVTDPYESGQCLSVLKWKPPHLNSVDFKLVITVQDKIGMLKQSVGNLLVGGLDQPFSQIRVTKELRKYDKKIIECKWEDNQWKFMRERTDKSFPNGYRTAQAVVDSIRNPVTEDLLITFIKDRAWRPNRKRASDVFAVPTQPAKKHHS